MSAPDGALKKRLADHVIQQQYLYEFFPAWQPVRTGIDALAGRTRYPLLKFWALRVDLQSEFLEIVMTPPIPSVPAKGAPADGMPRFGEMYSTTVSGFARANDCVAAINAGPFSPVNARVGEIRTVIGLFVADGRLVAAADAGFDALVFYKNGRAAIVSQTVAAAAVAAGTVQNAAGGFRIVLKNGLVERRIFGSSARHPRSAAGLSADGRYLYLLAIDGRWFDTFGATEAETGLLLRALGAEDGLNLDGGGSTALVLRAPAVSGAAGRLAVLNRPIHKQIPGKERAVATCIGVRETSAAALP